MLIERAVGAYSMAKRNVNIRDQSGSVIREGALRLGLDRHGGETSINDDLGSCHERACS